MPALWSQVFKNITWGPALQLAVLYAFLTAVGATLQGVLIAARKPLMFGTTTIMQAAAGGGLGIVLAGKHGAAGYLGGLCIGSVAVTVIALAVLYRPPLIRRDVIVGGLALGFPFMFHSLSQWGLIVSDRLIVAFYLGSMTWGATTSPTSWRL